MHARYDFEMSHMEISNRFYNALAATLEEIICDVVVYRYFLLSKYREYYNMYPRRARTAVLSKGVCPRGYTH